jgi:DNA-binding response OmpR family regulator
LNLPIKPGLEVLQWVRRHPAFKTLTVVIVSASGLDSDMDSAAKLGVTDYVIKPSSPAILIELVRERMKLWLHQAESSPRKPGAPRSKRG